MNQLVTKPARNAARQAKELKEIRKVKHAILWHEKQRKKRQELSQQRWETKQAMRSRLQWKQQNIIEAKKEALRNAKEDWELGALRPNRALGVDAAKYGAVSPERVQPPRIPVQSAQFRNEARIKRGMKPAYPLVVDKKKYFPIVADDRVVIIKGKDKGKIGVVQEVLPQTHHIIVKDLNMSYIDSDLFGSAIEEPIVKNMVPLDFKDVRLVVPYEIVKSGHRQISDVVVDDIDMERHTTGIDPFTGIDHGDAEIPEAHQVDPQTGIPIFNRYIAGSRQRIEWPWEREVALPRSSAPEENAAEKKTWFQKIRHPLKSWRESSESTATKETGADATTELLSIEQKELEKRKTIRPRSNDPKRPSAYNFDTTRNIVEGSDSMSYTLVAPPFPETLGQELRGGISEYYKGMREDPNNEYIPVKILKTNPKSIIAAELNKKKQAMAQRMKTPMQVRWELEQAKKKRSKPAVETDALLMALGQHMQKSGVKLPKTRSTEDLD